jgi:hypothetical protein
VFVDNNQNGVADAGEPSTSTDVNGNYKFIFTPSTNAAFTYHLTEVVKDGWRATFPQTGTIDQTLAAGEEGTANFANVADTISARLVGSVFNDANANGVIESGETRIGAGQVVYVDANNNGRLDSDELSTTSDSAGRYVLKVTPASATTAKYIIREQPRTGWRQTLPAAGGAISVDAKQGATITLPNFADTQRALISGNVFADQNGNKIKDVGEVGIQGVRVFIDLDNDGRFDNNDISTTTDASGNWSFSALPSGTYIIRAVAPSGFKQTTTTIGSVTVGAGVARSNLLIGFRTIS